ncbi:MAG: hypothetical protein AB1810_05010 [Pseudomonadota bacterium]
MNTKGRKSSLIIYLFALVILLISGCEKEAPAPVEPQRPSNVPETAFWVGGVDGGVFVSVRTLEESTDDLYYAEIYYVSGDLAYRGPMKIYPPDASFDPKIKESYEGWDGDNLYLNNNQYLRVQE